jgi:uncharacterized protein (TIGR02145 family)
MKKTFNLLIAALVLLTMAASCSNDEPNEPIVDEPTPERLVTPATLNATGTAGSYSITITSNVAWTTTKNAEWLTLTPASGEGNGTVIVNVADNLATAERAGTITVTAGELSKTVTVTQPMIMPPHAASTQTWVVGNQIWSDHINIPACNKEDFGESYTEPFCRSYVEDGTAHYYYNWTYVSQNLDALCPSPWRVPTQDDFMALDLAMGGNGDMRLEPQDWVTTNYINKWGGDYTGYASGESMYDVGEYSYYWSSELYFDIYALYLYYDLEGYVIPVAANSINVGYRVRCVR